MSGCLFHQNDPHSTCAYCDGHNKKKNPNSMTIDDMVNALRAIYDKYGNIEVRWRSLSRTFIPELEVRDDGPLIDGGSTHWILLNP